MTIASVPLAIARLDLGRGIVDAGAFEFGEPVDRQPAILHAGRDHDCLGADALAVVEGGAEALVVEPLQERHAPRHREARTELHRLDLAAPDQVGAGNAGRKAHVVLDPARRAGLAADRDILDDQRAQPFRAGIDPGGHAGRTAADDQHVEYLVVPEIEIEAEQPRDLVGRGIGHDDVAPEDHRGYARRDRAALGDRFGFRTAQRQRAVGNAVAARELRDAPHVPVVLLADQPKLLIRSSSWRRRRAENTVMMMSDISGI